MHLKTVCLLEEAISQPVKKRAMVVESILKSLSPPEPGIDKKWALVAKKRLVQLRTGAIVAVPGDEVFLIELPIAQ
ncbi:addiction module protein [Candidatus Accumulibacter phosphatis]|uniref:addiction module protein n=1 Tax=Candidatus Accumulibacter phosphatis TaxID=327160 RepID=UPI003D7C2FB1